MKNQRNKNYHIFNLTFAGLILLIFIYSGIFSAEKNNHPIPSIYTELTGMDSPSLGLSRSFSEIVRFNFSSAKELNPYGIKVFMFFLIQFILRILISISLHYSPEKLNLNRLTLFDATIALFLFIYSFWYFLPIWKFM